MATYLTFDDQLTRAIYSENVDEILRLCDDSSHMTSILGYKKDGMQLVHIAAQFGSVKLLDKLRGFGADLKIRSDDSNIYNSIRNFTTLHIACKYSHIDVVKYLLQTVQDCSFKNAATTQGKDKNYRNAFYYAAQSGNSEVVKCLQTLGKLDINELLPHNRTTLSVLVLEKDSKSARILCECGAKVNLGSFERGRTPIQYIAERPNHAEIIKVLLNFGANVNELWVKYSGGSLRQSPLFMALKLGLTDNAKALIEGGSDISFIGKTSNINMGPIGCFSLAAKRCPSLISEFLKRGADPNETHKGQSVLMLLETGYANNDAVKALVEAGADVNQRKDGKTLIQRCTCYAELKPFIEGGVSVKIIESEHKVYTISLALGERYRSDTKTISDLLSKGADPNLKPEGKDPPLIVATQNNQLDNVNCLIKAGAQLDDVCRDGDTAILMCCKKASHYGFQILNILIESGASLNIPGKEGEYPLEILAQRIKNVSKSTENEEIENCVTKMIAKGANPNITRKGRNSPIITAVKKQSESLVQIMLNARADILHVGEDHRTALDICFCNGSKSIRDIIIKALVDNPKWYMASETEMPYLVDMLIENGVEDSIIEYAVSRGVDPNRALLGKDSPLMKAITKQRYKISCVLIEAGADVTYANADGTNAFDIFSESCKTLKDSQDVKRNSGTEQDTDDQDWTEIMTKLFRCFMVSGIEVNKWTKYGIYPLQVSIWLNSVEMTKLVLEHDVDVNIVDDFQNAPLTIALENGNVDMVQLLLDAKAKVNFIKYIRPETETKVQDNTNINCTDKDLEDTLLTRVITGSANAKAVLVKMLLQAGADPNIAVKGVDSPLLHAVRTRNMEIVRNLIDAGADVKHVGLNCYTALHVYFKDHGNDIDLYEIDRQMRGYSGPSQILQLLLSAGAPTNSMSVSNEFPAHFALQLCSEMEEEINEEDICLLLDNFKDVNIPDNNGNTLLIIACAQCTLNIIDKIVLQGADVNFSGNNGLTALQAHMDSKTFDNEVVSLLVKHGAEINKINDLGETALIRYIKRGGPKVLEKNIEFLLEIGANPNTSVNGCHSALIEALSLNLFAVFACLMKAKSDVNHVGKNSTTALQVILRKVTKTKASSSEDKDFYFPARTNIEKELNKIRSTVYSVITVLLRDGADVNFLSNDGESPLYMLLKVFDTRLVNAILPLFIKKQADPNKGTQMPLILAAQKNRQKALKMLLEAGALVNKMNPQSETSLISSLRAFSKSLNGKNIVTVKILLESGASIDLKNEYGINPLSLPFMSSRHKLSIKPLRLSKRDETTMKMLSTLLEKGACPNSHQDGEDSSLMLAVENCLPECVQLLIKSGAHSDHIGKDGKTALHKCFSATGFHKSKTSGHGATGVQRSTDGELKLNKQRTNKKRQRIIELLLANGARVNIDEDGQDSPLLLAIQYGDIEAINALLKASANLSHRGQNKLNAFERCLVQEYSSVLQIFDILLQHQTPAKESIDSSFYLLWEYVKEKESLSKPLLENVCLKLLSTDTDITVNLSRPTEDSPLIFFCRFQCLEVVRMLLERKADVNHIGTRGKTVLHTLIDIKDKDAFDFQQMVEIIFSAKPKLDIKDECDKSPIDKSCYMYYDQYCHNYLELRNIGLLVQHLLDAGASLSSSKLDKLLKKAAENGDFKTMESVCRHGANKDMIDKNENTILHICWSKTLDGALQFLEYYMQKGGFLNSINTDGNSPLLVLLKNHSRINDERQKKEVQIANIAAYFMKNTTSEILDKHGNSPLHVAVEAGMVNTVEALLAFGAIASKQNHQGRTALHLCLEKPKSNIVEIVSKLAESGKASINLELSGCTPLFLATNLYRDDYTCKNELLKLQSQVVEILMEHGAHPNSHNSSSVPLLSAVQAGDVDTVSVLLEKGALVNVTNDGGESALHILFSERSGISEGPSIEIGMILLRAGADPSVGHCLQSVLKNYKLRENVELFLELLKTGANPNMYSGSSSNLIEVTKEGNKQLVEELLRYRADVNFVDSYGKSALHHACDIEAPSEKNEIINLLITNGANLNLISTDLKRPLDCLIYRMVDDVQELDIRHDEIHRHHYLKIDLSSFNQLIRCGSHLAPIENGDTGNNFGEYCMSPDFSSTTSSFMVLIKNGLFTAAMSLVRCGWNIEKEKWIDCFDISKLNVSMVQVKFEKRKRIDVEKTKEDFSNFLETFKKSTEPLSILCRNSIRKQMVFSSGGSEIETKIQALQLPKTIRSFLNLTECMPDEEIIMLDKTRSFDSALYGYSDPTDLHAVDYFNDELVDCFLW